MSQLRASRSGSRIQASIKPDGPYLERRPIATARPGQWVKRQRPVVALSRPASVVNPPRAIKLNGGSDLVS